MPVHDTPSERKRLEALFSGLGITPRVVWDALPWSWLIDYFFNIGEILSNLYGEVVDRQLSTRAYLMQESNVTYTRSGSDGYLHAQIARKVITKVRRKVDPYGVAIDQDLSIKQTMILAALGISRT